MTQDVTRGNLGVYKKWDSSGNLTLVVDTSEGGDIVVDGDSLIDEIAALSGLDSGELGVLNGVTAGTVTASKAMVVDANKDIGTLRHLTISGNFVTGSTTLSEADLAKIDGITNGTQAAGKAVVADSNVNTGVSKVTELHIGATGAETQVTSTAAELNILDGVTATAAELNYCDVTTPGTQEASKAVVTDANVNSGISKVTELHIGATGAETQVTSTAAELNILDGVTATATELNYCDVTTPGTQEASKAVITDANVNSGISKVTELHIGATGAETQVTSTAAELNILDGVTATASELNYCDVTTPGTQEASKAVITDANVNSGISKVTELHIGATGAETQVTATAAELNYCDVTTPGTQEASKAVITDANTNSGISKVTQLHIGASGSEVQVNTTPAQLNVTEYDAGNMAAAFIDFNATGEAAMSVTIDGVVYQEADVEDFANGVWTNGASAANSATSLISAINGDTRASVPFTALADVSGDGVWLYWDAAGTAGNVTITTTSGGNCTVENSTGGEAAALQQTARLKHTINTQELLSGATEIPLPFTPTGFTLNCYSSAGAPIYTTDLVTIQASPDRLRIATNGATSLANTDVVYVYAWA